MHRKGLVIGILILMLGVNIGSTFAGDTDVKTMSSVGFDGNTLYVGGSGPNNYTSIQAAIDDAVDGDTVYVFNESSPYNENVVIDKSVNLIGEDKNTTIIDGCLIENTILVDAEWVNISGFTIQGGDWAGIYITSDYNMITDNNLTDNHRSIHLTDSSSNSIIGNSIINNHDGIYLYGSSSNNIISENTITDIPEFFGITLVGKSNNNKISDNEISNNGQSGIMILSSNNTIIGNKVTNNFYGINLMFADDNSIYWNSITDHHSGFAVVIDNSFNNDIYENNIKKNLWGIWLLSSYDNNIYHNNFIMNILSANFRDSDNEWNENYWNRPRLLPKPIFGIMGFIPWLNIDWHPAQEPYGIGV